MKPLNVKSLSLYAIIFHLIATLTIEGSSSLFSPLAISRSLIATILFYLFNRLYQSLKTNALH